MRERIIHKWCGNKSIAVFIASYICINSGWLTHGINSFINHKKKRRNGFPSQLWAGDKTGATEEMDFIIKNNILKYSIKFYNVKLH